MLTMSFIDGFSEHFCYQIKTQSIAVTGVDDNDVTFFVQFQVHKYFISHSYIVQGKDSKSVNVFENLQIWIFIQISFARGELILTSTSMISMPQ